MQKLSLNTNNRSLPWSHRNHPPPHMRSRQTSRRRTRSLSYGSLHHRPREMHLHRPTNSQTPRSSRHGPRRRTPSPHTRQCRSIPDQPRYPRNPLYHSRHLLDLPEQEGLKIRRRSGRAKPLRSCRWVIDRCLWQHQERANLHSSGRRRISRIITTTRSL